jgi:hypothetical protein
MKRRYNFFVLLAFFSLPTWAKCQTGTKLILSFDQKTQTFSSQKPIKAEVCHWVKDQLNSNVRVKYFNKGQQVFEHTLLFPLITIHEKVNKTGKMRPHASKESFQKIINIPVEREFLETFRVFDLTGNEILSEGIIK